ncbi:MAG: LCP family protein [Oscillospiraceae bacterium]|jgi:anionic cell wall polymer biosynthesis LytR-Cps2A-Psr (LCP) family protein|nr:LCP family protein [Oscillospiraceae bacterium]
MATIKKRLRRRSNWYIYLISFAAAFAALSLFILAYRDVFFPEVGAPPAINRQGYINYVPSEDLDVTVLLMLSETTGGTPGYFMLMNYRPRDERIVLVPLKAETYVSGGGRSGKLAFVYGQGGAEAVMRGIKETFRIECGFYIKFDRTSFVNFAELMGDTPVKIPYDISEGNISFASGSAILSGADLYNYITFRNFKDGEDYRLVAAGSSLASFINSNGRNLTTEKIQNLFNKILNNADTDMTFKDYKNYQQALFHTSENADAPAVFYIPYGETDGSGAFIIAGDSADSILEKFNISIF